MHGMVMEVNDKTLIILTNDGEFIEIERTIDTISVGDQVPYYTSRNIIEPHNKLNRYISLVASILILCMASLSGYAYTQPFGYVNVDINPSAVVSYNWFERVIEIKPLNEDAKVVIEALQPVKSRNINDVIDDFVAVSADQGFLSKENTVYISVSDKKSKDRSVKILKNIDDSVIIPADSEKVLVLGNKKSFEKVNKNNLSLTSEIFDESVGNDDVGSIIFKSSKPMKDLLKTENELKKEMRKEIGEEIRLEIDKEVKKEMRKELIEEIRNENFGIGSEINDSNSNNNMNKDIKEETNKGNNKETIEESEDEEGDLDSAVEVTDEEKVKEEEKEKEKEVSDTETPIIDENPKNDNSDDNGNSSNGNSGSSNGNGNGNNNK